VFIPAHDPHRAPRILLVDDDVEDLDVMAQILRIDLPDAEIIACVSGEDALDLLRTERIDVLVIDMVMPRMSGLEALARFRIESGRARVIVVSGMVSPIAIEIVDGVDAWHSKPVDVDALVADIRRLLAR
jgi:CheY-like chemotaxis protein